MLRKYKITYVKDAEKVKPKLYTVKLDATSKYDAKERFYFQYPKYGIVKTEEVEV